MSGVFASKLIYNDGDGRLEHRLSQPTEGLILDRNSEVRKNPGIIKDLGAGQEGGTWGRQVASIPLIIFENALKQGYQLTHKDASIAEKEMARFLRSDEGKKCLLKG